ncbi:MAG: ABC transporter substrate-binding protein [Alphaproteobacteria bacterium]
MKRMNLVAVSILALGLCASASLALAKTPAPKEGSKPVTKTQAATTSPSSTVKEFYTQLVGTMKQGDQLGYAGRFKKLEPTIKSAYNLPLMTRLAVGPAWEKATASEQEQLISAFSDFSVANYASRFAKYDGEQFEVTGEKPVSGGVIVETKLTPKDGEAVVLNYMMRPDEKGEYRIVDVFLDGSISELATRRAEFTSIVTREGLPALVNSLGAKSKQMGPS